MNQFYEKLADALDALPNGFPRVETGSDLRLLAYMYTVKEAEILSQMSGKAESPNEIAQRLDKLPKEVQAGLFSMTRNGKVWIDMTQGRPKFRLAAFVVGSYEAHYEHMNEKMAVLFEDYLNDGGVKKMMGLMPSFHRVVPTVDIGELEWILPYDNVMKIIENAKTFHVQECICRLQQDGIGKGCDMPKQNCLSFTTTNRKPKEGDITKEEAIKIIMEAEEAGLVHSVSNVVDGLHYICNCCGCCCGVLRGITQWGIENSMARANYEAIIDKEACIGCEVCVGRCQVSAITMDDDVADINRDQCLGCAVCVSKCPADAISMQPRPKSEQVEPPKDFGQWEKDRLENRKTL